MDSEAPTITVEIGQHCVIRVQLDGGSAVSLMTDQTMQELGFTNLEPTNIVLRVADQRRVKPLGIIQGVKTTVGGLEFHVSYLVVKPHSYAASFPILMGRPWLLQAQCVQIWHKGTITIGPGNDRVQLRVVSREFLREPYKQVTTDENTATDVEESSSDERPVSQKFALDKEKFRQFLHNGYQMQVDDSKETLIGNCASKKYATHVGMGE